MRNVNCVVLSAPDNANANGNQVDSNQLVSASFHVVFGDSSAAGTVKLQVSNDICNDRYQASNFTVTNWVDMPASLAGAVTTATIASGAQALLTVPQMTYRWIRAVFTHSGGGTTTIIVNMNALSV